jgi:hypothetical protein
LQLEALYADYCSGADSPAAMITVYIEEAHPLDGWYLAKAKGAVKVRQPRDTLERVAIAQDFVKRVSFPAPLVVDTIANEANFAYEAWPERLYVICDGVVQYKGGQGRAAKPCRQSASLSYYLQALLGMI